MTQTGRLLDRVLSNQILLKCSQKSTVPKQWRHYNEAQPEMSNSYTTILYF